jgi:hypothetical protein
MRQSHRSLDCRELEGVCHGLEILIGWLETNNQTGYCAIAGALPGQPIGFRLNGGVSSASGYSGTTDQTVLTASR